MIKIRKILESIDKVKFFLYYIRVCVELSVSGYNVF